MGIRELELADLPQTSDPPVGPLAAIINRLTWPFRYGHVEPQPSTGFYTDTTVCIGCKSCEVACKQWNQLAADGLEWTGNSYDNTAELSATSWRHVKFIEQFAANGRPTGHDAADPAATSHELTLDQLLTGARRVGVGRSGGDEPRTDPRPVAERGRGRSLADDERRLQALRRRPLASTRAPRAPSSITSSRTSTSSATSATAARIASRPARSGSSRAATSTAIRTSARSATTARRTASSRPVPRPARRHSIQFGPIDELRERARNRVEELHARGVTGAYLYGDEPTETYSELHSFYLLVDRPAVYGLPDAPFNPWLHMLGDYGRTLVSALATIAVILALLFLQGV